MVFGWLRKRRRRRLLDKPFPSDWEETLHRLSFYRHLTEGERARLRDTLRVIAHEKHWEGCGGFEITPLVKVTIAAQAALLVLNLEHEHYSRVTSILVYPSAYRSGREDHGGTLGEAWSLGGPVVLSWDAAQRGAVNARDGRNLVFHEFAHKLDFLDGAGDGTPPLRNAKMSRSWKRIMTEKFDGLVKATETGRLTLLDKYGATNPSEFFAVCTECFFERGPQLERRHPELYTLLRDYYGQDPARWV